MEIRPAVADDTPFLKDLRRQVYRDVVLRQFGTWDPVSQDARCEVLLREASFHIVELHGERIGTLGVREFPDAFHILELQIAPPFQGKGLGSAVLEAQLERARDLRKPVRLRVLLQNRALSLYVRLGFLIDGQDDTHYSMLWLPPAS